MWNVEAGRSGVQGHTFSREWVWSQPMLHETLSQINQTNKNWNVKVGRKPQFVAVVVWM